MENLNNYCFLKVDDFFFRLVWLVMSEIFKLEKWDLSMAVFYLGNCFWFFYFSHSTIVIFWPYIDNLGLSRCFLAQIWWYLVLTLSYNIIDNLMVLWKKSFSFLKTVVPSLPPTALCDCQEKKIRSAMLIYHT